MSISPYESVEKISGVGKVTVGRLAKLGINTVKDLIYFFPRAYERRGEIQLLINGSQDIPSSFLLTVSSEVRSAKVKSGITISKFRAFDDSGSVEVVYFNSPFIKDVFHIGSVFRFYGKISWSKNKLQLVSPKHEPYVEGIPLPDLVPIYPLTAGISSKSIEKLVRTAINESLNQMPDPLPDDLRISNSLPTLSYAIKNSHFPESEDALHKSLERLAFDELLSFGIGVSMSAHKKNIGDGVRFTPCSLEPVLKQLPYELTSSQKQAVNDIYRDTVVGEGGRISPMARIIVGDVGCGKTICAALAIYIAYKSGYQSTLMVPTEILATQHYQELSTLLGNTGARVELLIGSTTQKEKKRIREALARGEVDLVVGTHTLISDKTEFNKLGLIVTDEQHRFGVNQRSVLKERAETAHLLVMSATPIPRTLALTLYGDLSISRITEMPKGRQRVDTFLIGDDMRQRLNGFISKQVGLGRQCYIVCPSIEQNLDEDALITERIGEMVSAASTNLKSVVEYSEELRRALPDLRIEILHGKLKPQEKDDIMAAFAAGKCDVLVSTTVIEVGVNVPNATLMVVENAERFGLSQLHQLRGRVGRGSEKSYCVLVSDNKSDRSRDRLEVIRTTYDGYAIAESDLALRGPGDFFASTSGDNFRQSGGFEFKFASKLNDTSLYEKAFSTAKAIVESDPDLSAPDHKGLREILDSFFSLSIATIS